MAGTANAERVLEMALEAGFDLAGIAPLAPPPAAARFRAWLEAGRHAGMGWLERNRERIADPRRVLPEARSLLVVGQGHARRAVTLPGGGRVARYAAGRDYHNLLGRRLEKLARRLEREGVVRSWRRVVDAGPLLERSHAAVAGLGFESKAANLLHPDWGPWFFLGELLLDAELEPTGAAGPGVAPGAGSCGTCTACLDACPTDAIVAPGEVDANLCISYHTIENRGAIPEPVRERLGGWVFGCDVCSEVCPWGAAADDRSDLFGTHEQVARGTLADWLAPARSDGGPAGDRDGRAADFARRFNGSPLQRPRREGLARNAALALAHVPPDEAGRSALARAAQHDPSPLVREAAGWSLARAHGGEPATRALLERLARSDPDAACRAALEARLS